MRFLRISFYCAILWYVGLISIHLLKQRPLWNDEQCVALSLRSFKLHEIFTQGLLSVQAFPKTYLWCIQQISRPFDFPLLLLRGLPFLAMLCAFFLWQSITRDAWRKDYLSRFLFALSWVASIPLVYYAAELKQYSMDVCVGGLLVWGLMRFEQQRLSAWVWMGFPFCMLFSYAAIFLTIIPALQLFRRKSWPEFYVYLVLWVVVLAVIYSVDMRVSTGNAAALKAYWQDYFISYQSWGSFFKSFGEGVNNLISRWFAENPKWIRAVSRVFMGGGFLYILVEGFRQMSKDRFYFRSVAGVGFFIFILLCVLGSLQMFLFTVPRTSLFFAPFLFFAFIEGLRFLKEKALIAFWPMLTAYVIFLLICAVGVSRVVLTGYLGAQSPI